MAKRGISFEEAATAFGDPLSMTVSDPDRSEEKDRFILLGLALDETKLYVVAPEDLVLSKLVWARENLSELQRRDVRNMLQCAKELDWAYLESWADKLSVRALLEEARKVDE